MNPSVPILVGGGHRTGTTLLRYILDGHSRIYCGPELKFFRAYFGHHPNGDMLHAIRFFSCARFMLPDADVLSITGQAMLRIIGIAAERARKPRWACKEPDNALYLTEWEKLLPSGFLYLHMIRDPVDAIFSMQETNWRESLPTDVPALITEYLRHVSAFLEYRERRPERCIAVRYEALVASPVVYVRALMRELGEDLEPQQLDFSARPGAGLGDPKIRATTTVHGKSVGRGRALMPRADVELIDERTKSALGVVMAGHGLPAG